MRDNYYRLGEGFLIVYSITMRDTFRSVNRFYDHIMQVKGKEDGEVHNSPTLHHCVGLTVFWVAVRCQ
jgi:hypothetical protein